MCDLWASEAAGKGLPALDGVVPVPVAAASPPLSSFRSTTTGDEAMPWIHCDHSGPARGQMHLIALPWTELQTEQLGTRGHRGTPSSAGISAFEGA